MVPLETQLTNDLMELEKRALSRSLSNISSAPGTIIESEGRQYVNFSSNDYLGLATHPVLKQAAQEAISNYGTGTGSSRLISGSNTLFHELEATLALFKGTDSALVFSTGYAATMGAIPCLFTTGDVILVDRLAHASIVDASRFSGACLRVFRHNDVGHLNQLLQWASLRAKSSDENQGDSNIEGEKSRPLSRAPRILIATESVFSMDGDTAPLADIVELKEKYKASLFLDEAHATGVCGAHGKGLADACGVSKHVDIAMGTLGKALGSSGGFVCGSSNLIKFLVNRARTFLFSTAPIPASAAASRVALNLVSSDEGESRRTVLWKNINLLSSALNRAENSRSAICPVFIGLEEKALAISRKLRDDGFFVPAIRYPTVARGKARLRISLSSEHTAEQIHGLVSSLNRALTQNGSAP